MDEVRRHSIIKITACGIITRVAGKTAVLSCESLGILSEGLPSGKGATLPVNKQWSTVKRETGLTFMGSSTHNPLLRGPVAEAGRGRKEGGVGGDPRKGYTGCPPFSECTEREVAPQHDEEDGAPSRRRAPDLAWSAQSTQAPDLAWSAQNTQARSWPVRARKPVTLPISLP